jgi:hypothetical protein
MICYAITQYSIHPAKVSHFVSAVEQGGLWAELAKEMPGYIGTSVLESDQSNDLYLVIDFWESKYAYFESEFSPIGKFLADFLCRLTYSHSNFGPFTFPPTDLSTEEFIKMTDDSSAKAPTEIESTELACQ